MKQLYCAYSVTFALILRLEYENFFTIFIFHDAIIVVSDIPYNTVTPDLRASLVVIVSLLSRQNMKLPFFRHIRNLTAYLLPFNGVFVFKNNSIYSVISVFRPEEASFRFVGVEQKVVTPVPVLKTGRCMGRESEVQEFIGAIKNRQID